MLPRYDTPRLSDRDRVLTATLTAPTTPRPPTLLLADPYGALAVSDDPQIHADDPSAALVLDNEPRGGLHGPGPLEPRRLPWPLDEHEAAPAQGGRSARHARDLVAFDDGRDRGACGGTPRRQVSTPFASRHLDSVRQRLQIRLDDARHSERLELDRARPVLLRAAQDRGRALADASPPP